MGAGLCGQGQKPYNFRNKHVFITGGTNGIGFSIARLLLKRGARVSLVDIADPGPNVQSLRTSIADSEQRIFVIKGNVADYEQV